MTTYLSNFEAERSRLLGSEETVEKAFNAGFEAAIHIIQDNYILTLTDLDVLLEELGALDR